MNYPKSAGRTASLPGNGYSWGPPDGSSGDHQSVGTTFLLKAGLASHLQPQPEARARPVAIGLLPKALVLP